VIVWGTGKPRREFLAADDLGDACVFVRKHYSGDGFLNIGTGQEISIGEVAYLVAEVVEYRGKLACDPRAMTRGWIATINRPIVSNVRSVRIGTK